MPVLALAAAVTRALRLIAVVLSGSVVFGVCMVNILDVAREAGVSKTTVSYVISGNPKITKKTAGKVHKAMQKLGYTVNHSARALSTSRTMTLGVATSDIEDIASSPLLKGIYFSGLSDYARKRGYDILLMVDEDGTREIEDAARAQKIDGLILMDIDSHDPRVGVAVDSGVPTVLFGMPEKTQGLDVVDTNFEQAAHNLVNRFAQGGHKEIILASKCNRSDSNPLNYTLRFIRAAEDEAARCNIRIEQECIDADATEWSLHEALLRHPNATGVIVEDQDTAVSARLELEQAHMAVPGDISLAVLLADVVYERMRMPPTSACIDTRTITSSVVDALLRRIDNPDAGPGEKLIDTSWHDEGTISAV